MLAKNLEVQRGLVNGARGVVVGYDKKNQGRQLCAKLLTESSNLL